MAQTDDYTNDKSTTGLINNPDNGIASGVLDVGGDEDWFKVNLTAGKSYYIADTEEVSNNRNDRDERLLDSTGKQVTFINPEGGTIFTPEKSGVYYLSVWTPSASFHLGGYAIGIKSFVDDYANSIKAAKPIKPFTGQTILQGRLQVSIDIDIVSLPNKPGKIYTLQFDPKMYGCKILNTQGQDKSVVLSSGLLMSPKPGQYYLQVGDGFTLSGYDATSKNYSVSLTEYSPYNGSKNNDVLTASAGNSAMFGRDGNDTLHGSKNNDILDGGFGKDMMYGGLGNDIYIVTESGDRITETSNSPKEIDTVYSSASYVLPANVENLTLRHTNAKGLLIGQGNNLNNTIVVENFFRAVILKGEAGNDILKGQGTLIGGLGNDIIEGDGKLIGGQGNDTLKSNNNSQLIGGQGKDIYIINGDTNVIKINPGDSLLNNFDIIKNFSILNDANFDYANYIQLENTKAYIAKDVLSANGKDVENFRSHHIDHGFINFSDTNKYLNSLIINSDNINQAIKYVHTNINKLGEVVAFKAGKDTYLFQDNGSNDTLIKLQGVNNAADLFLGKNNKLALVSYIDDFGNDPKTAAPIKLAPIGQSTVIKGKLDYNSVISQDVDVFSISLQAGTSYFIRQEVDPSLKIYDIDILNSKEKKIAHFDDYSNEPFLTFTADTTSKHYLKVNNAWPSNYSVTLTPLLTINGTDQSDILNGSNAPELMNGFKGDDILNGNLGEDILHGGVGNDQLNGGQDNDYLYGDAGKDMMNGGLGNDVYFVDNRGDIVQEISTDPNEVDTVYSTFSYALPDNVENLIFQPGVNKITGQGNALNNYIYGNQYDVEYTLKGGAGNDRLEGRGILMGEDGDDIIKARGFTKNVLIGGIGKDQYSLGYGYDNTIQIAQGESLTTAYDIVSPSEKNTIFNTKFNLASKTIAGNVVSVDGIDSGILRSHYIKNGLINFDNLNTYQSPLNLTTKDLPNAIKYLESNITQNGDTVAFNIGHDSYLFQDNGNQDTFVQLVGTTVLGLTNIAVDKGMIFLV